MCYRICICLLKSLIVSSATSEAARISSKIAAICAPDPMPITQYVALVFFNTSSETYLCKSDFDYQFLFDLNI